ncbi:MAG: ribonuclease HII [Bacteroidales bacterium]
MEKVYVIDGVEVGCDEAGRGCLAGPVVAGAVILPKDCSLELDDSKKLSEKKRMLLRPMIEKEAIAFGIGLVSPDEIDKINILNASFLAMHRALDKINVSFDRILVDGNRFNPYKSVPHHCMIKGDGRFMSIAAASILAKTFRDELMEKLHEEHPCYDWKKNKGYPTKFHRQAIEEYGITDIHRKTFKGAKQLKLFI